MSKQGLENQKNYPLHKKVREFFWGGWFMQGLWNYERQMNTAFMWGISGTLDRLYPEPEELEKKKDRYNAALEFFNITPQLGAFVLGLTAAMEEKARASAIHKSSAANALTPSSRISHGK